MMIRSNIRRRRVKTTMVSSIAIVVVRSLSSQWKISDSALPRENLALNWSLLIFPQFFFLFSINCYFSTYLLIKFFLFFQNLFNSWKFIKENTYTLRVRGFSVVFWMYATWYACMNFFYFFFGRKPEFTNWINNNIIYHELFWYFKTFVFVDSIILHLRGLSTFWGFHQIKPII